MIARLFCVGLAGVASLFAGYTYDSNSQPLSAWQLNGGATVNQAFLFGTGGSAMYKPAVSGANPNDYEVLTRMFLTPPSGQNYVTFLRANSAGVQAGSGSYISVELNNTGPGAVAQLVVNQCVNGVVTQLLGGATYVLANQENVLRSVVIGNTLWVLFNNVNVVATTIPQTTGSPGVGAYGPHPGFFDLAAVGHRDSVAPLPISPAPVGSSILPTSVSLRWPGTTDDPSGIGLYAYLIFRNGLPDGSSLEPDFADNTVQPATAYTYQVVPMDQHLNQGPALTFNITTPPAQDVDPRRVGVNKNGTYWGGGGEQIDTLSRNLSFSIPLLTTEQRSGQTHPLGLSYNSQNWRQDSGFNWQLATDIGYGLGWKLQFGSVTPYYVSWFNGVDHYVFTDGTGAEYRLDQNNGNVWSSLQNVHVWFDANTERLHFEDGSFWYMGCTSGGLEPDAGTMYPTTLEDVNGNQIIVVYYGPQAPPGFPTLYEPNTSGRMFQIEDFRSGYGSTAFAYLFTQNSDAPVPHITSVTSMVGTPESHTFTYSTSALSPPFGTDSRYAGATATWLGSVSVPITTNKYAFTYDSAGAGELQQVTFPYGGHLRWHYRTFQYANSRSMREIDTRYLAADSAGATEWTYNITDDESANPGPTVHANMTLADASGIGAKTWNFYTTNSGVAAWGVGLLSSFVQQSAVGGTVLQRDSFGWTDSLNEPYIYVKVSVLDEATANVQAQSMQTLDGYGNVLNSSVYPYNNTTTPLQAYTNSYIYAGANGSSYASNYVVNRLLSSTLTTGGTTKTLATNQYDFIALTPSGAPLDPLTPVPAAYRGNLSNSTTPVVSTQITRWDTGDPQYVSRSDGRTVSLSADSATGYSAPMSIATESYSQAVTYNSWLGITSTTGTNGEQLSMTYDSAGRPLTGTSAYGGVTTYTYSSASSMPPLWQQESGAGGVTKTTLDGLGRAIRVERGDGAGTKSIVDTVYAPCACSPLGKIQKVSQPYAPGGTPVWTVYTYDGLGRTVSVLQPDGASTTTYSYSGNTTTVTDPAGKWKTFTKDVLGNLTRVVEPDPSNQPGGTLTTTYTYDWMNHVSGVTMTRAGTTQTRSFNYSDAGLLTSATNPENGTVNYYYGSDNTLWYKHDAKGQDTVYTYDGAKRVTKIQRYPQGKANSEDVCQRTTYAYGTNPSTYNYGRLVSAQASPGGYCVGYGTAPIPSYGESYTYNAGGGVASKSIVSNMFRVGDTPEYSPLVTYGYDSYGRSTTVRYPVYSDLLFTSLNNASNIPTTFTTMYDSMGRPTGMTDDGGFTWVQNGTYDYAGRPQSVQILSTTETRAYNTSGQLSSIGWNTPGFAEMTGGMTGSLSYIYSTTQNNGQIQQMVDTVSGEAIAYQYDTLKRLTSATSYSIPGSAAASWTETLGYDGFGNLTGKTLNGILQSIPVVAQSNRLSSAIYDANGNMTSGAGATLAYNVDNRMISAAEVSGGIEYYEYAPDGKRVWRQRSSGIWEFTFYGAHGERLGVYSASAVLPGCACIRQEMNVLFAGKLIWQGLPNGTASITGTVLSDRLGSNRNGARFYPYGDEITSSANDRVKFGTYTRDSYTGLDYADQRFFASTYGRFDSADPYKAAGATQGSVNNSSDPGTWNRYAYVGGDPGNLIDPRGEFGCNPAVCDGYGWGDQPSGPHPILGNDPSSGYPGTHQAPQQVAYSFAQVDRGLVQQGAMTDCQGLAAFASAIAPLFSSATAFVQAFGVLTPAALSNLIPGIAFNTQYLELNSGQASGYQSQYQNTLPDNPVTGWNGDQGHHFAAFFQFGFVSGSTSAGSLAAFGLEYFQGLDSGVMNLGDVALGEAAAQIGASLRAGTITTAQVAQQIGSTLCQH